MKPFLFYFIFLMATVSTFAQTEKKTILFIGNSYTYYNELPQLCTSIAASMGDVLVMEQSTFGGYKLEQHVSKDHTLEKIKQGMPDYNNKKTRLDYNYVVLQEHSQYPSENREHIVAHTFPAINFLDSMIKAYNPSAQLIFYETWGRKNGDKSRCEVLPAVCTYAGMDSVTTNTYHMLAKRYSAMLSPVGEVWNNIRANYPNIELYNEDESHPSIAGSYASACTFYALIFGKDPRKIQYDYLLPFDEAYAIKQAVYEVMMN